ncbi:uncharacterized protein LOC131681449 [Topomyia yanbarensis]|uniref:uncharacterized protein LOC131681449 n=1 Tax=Topomyia yanbarensis TaxID=2498891 RepID=UPI00273B9B8E|nr:uncharacterized protein LOC131681449 [Topomyia yanbarensis]
MKNLLIAVILAGLAAVSVSANSCFVCSTKTTQNCLYPDMNILMRDCNSVANNFTCYSRIVDREIERGCSSALSREDFANCNDATNCELCYDVVNQGRCNGAVFPSHRLHCHQCAGHVNDTCGQEIQTTAQLCRLYTPDDQCFVSVVGDLVERGCLSESDFCRVGQTCHTCDGNGCNYKHYDAGAMSVIISLKTIAMALLAAMVYGSFKQ